MKPAARPVLGIIACARQVGTETAQAVMERYVRAAMTFAHANAFLIPSLPDLQEADVLMDRLDGVLLTGSPSNLSPERYGPAVEDAPGPFDPGRDEMVLRLVEAATQRAKPIFGICRGFQELNVAFGGSLRRDASSSADLLPHHAPDGVAFDGMFEHKHKVRIEPGGVLDHAYNHAELMVNSVHFQGVERLGHGLHAEAHAPDGLVEAFSADVNGSSVLAVQWHPEWRTERDPDSQTFFGLLGQALRGERLAHPTPKRRAG